MIKVINLNVILLSLAIAYGILKIINSYNDKKMEYSVGSDESLPEQGSWIVGESYSGPESLADIDDEFTFDELRAALKIMKEELEKEIKEELEKEISDTHVFLKNSFRYRFDRCVYRETEDESCKNGAVDLGIDNICCDIIAWDRKYMNHVPNSNITIDDKTYKHDFIDCVSGKYNGNGYYHINKFKIDCEKVVCTFKRYFHSRMDYWFLPEDTDFSCKLNVSRIDHAPGSTYISSYDFHIPPIDNWGDFHIPHIDLGGSISILDDHTAQISNIDEWNDEELKDYLHRAKRTPYVISEKVLPIHQLFQNNVKSNVEKYMENMYGTETEELDFGDEVL